MTEGDITRTLVTGTSATLAEAVDAALHNSATFDDLPEPIAYRVTIERWHSSTRGLGGPR